MRICAIGDPHGSLDKIKGIHLSDVDLILLTGDLGDAKLMRKMAFDNIERKNRALMKLNILQLRKRNHLWKLIIPL